MSNGLFRPSDAFNYSSAKHCFPKAWGSFDPKQLWRRRQRSPALKFIILKYPITGTRVSYVNRIVVPLVAAIAYEPITKVSTDLCYRVFELVNSIRYILSDSALTFRFFTPFVPILFFWATKIGGCKELSSDELHAFTSGVMLGATFITEPVGNRVRARFGRIILRCITL